MVTLASHVPSAFFLAKPCPVSVSTTSVRQPGIFLLQVPDAIAKRIYKRAGVEPSFSDRARGFWYCVWKHNIPITITEGAKKAASLLSQGHAAIGLPGIYAGYRSKDEHGYDIVPRLHEELAVFATTDREIKFCFDYETRPKTKRNIEIAISRTGHLLEQQGAMVSVVNLPGPEKGVDDLIKARGPLAYEKQATASVPLQTWVKHNRQQFIQGTTSTQRRPILLASRIQAESKQTRSQERSDERPRQLDTVNHFNQGSVSTRTDNGESRVNAGVLPRTRTNQYRLEAGDLPTTERNNREHTEFVAGVEGLSDAIRRTVELLATERIASAIARVSASIRDFKPPTRRHSDLRSALERLHQGIREQHHRTNELTAGLTTAVTRLNQQITADAQRQIDSLSSAIRNHAETRALAQQPALAEALNRLQQKFAVVLEQKNRTRQQLKQTLSTVQSPISTQVGEQLQSAIASLDSQLSQQSVLINQINQLSEREFLQLRQQVRAYFEALPPAPPTQAERQRVSQEMSRLSTQINQHKQQHSSLAQAIEQMQKNPFRLLNKKLDEAFASLESTFKSIEHAIAQKDFCLQQLQKWALLESAHQSWSSNPQTEQMRQIASVLLLPTMQERLTKIHQQLQQQAELRRDQQQGQQRRSGRGR